LGCYLSSLSIFSAKGKMMPSTDFVKMMKRVEKLTIDNSPSILTAIAATGVVTTAFLTGKASISAYREMAEEQAATTEILENKEVVRLVWKNYIPPVISGTLTIAAVITANRVGNRRAAAVATAYSISERAFSEYREKVVEKIGEKKDRTIRDEIAQDHVTKNPPDEKTVIITARVGNVLCYDMFTGRYFNSCMETLKQAENSINHDIIHNGYASLSDFYDEIGLGATSFSDEVGWSGGNLMEVIFSTTLADDNKPCITLDFNLSPNRNFQHFAQ
jgi:ACT domain-containing protein